jgi:mono/diheme cytochrome c family protein
MLGMTQLAFALCLLWSMHAWAQDPVNHQESRGDMLYSTQCSACHSAKIHWRDQKLVTDWNSLRFQVRRWQASIGLNWSDEEIADVARYLDAAYYHFANTDQKDTSQDKKPSRSSQRY